ncbi:hypothetical protein FQN50_009727 [Emmonsiellopsis sp. PD_5]|nr:hypothetical protein FQN50_009727 [Emmonsiellopsis sp. PD_5]
MGFDRDSPLTHEKFQDIVKQSKGDWTKDDYQAFSLYLYNLILRSGESCKKPFDDAETYMKSVQQDAESIKNGYFYIEPEEVEDWKFFLSLASQKVNDLKTKTTPLQDQIKVYRDLEQRAQQIGEPGLREIPKEID